MTGPTDDAYEAAARAYNRRSRELVGAHFLEDAHLGQRKTFRAAVDSAFAAGHAAYMNERRAEIAASLAEPAKPDSREELRGRVEQLVRAKVAAEIRAAPGACLDAWESIDGGGLVGMARRAAYEAAARIAEGGTNG
jgi:hypothetical protein